MENVNCNIDQTDKIHRLVVGALLLIGALLDLGRGFMLFLAIVLLVEGFLGKCGIPLVVAKYKELMKK